MWKSTEAALDLKKKVGMLKFAQNFLVGQIGGAGAGCQRVASQLECEDAQTTVCKLVFYIPKRGSNRFPYKTIIATNLINA